MAEIARMRARNPEEALTRLASVRDALAALVSRLDEVHAHPAYKSVWTLHMIHGGRYDGPTYVEELARAREALEPSSKPSS